MMRLISSLAVSLALVLVTSNAALANWQVYREDDRVVASVDTLSFEPFHGQPSVWVRWHYVRPRKGVGGVKIQFTAQCPKRKLFEIATYPYDTKGNFLTPHKNYDKPKEYSITPNSLNASTYQLLCH